MRQLLLPALVAILGGSAAVKPAAKPAQKITWRRLATAECASYYFKQAADDMFAPIRYGILDSAAVAREQAKLTALEPDRDAYVASCSALVFDEIEPCRVEYRPETDSGQQCADRRSDAAAGIVYDRMRKPDN